MAGSTSTSTSSTSSTDNSNPCPRCGKVLTDAAGLGWCPACGYCRALEETPQVKAPEPQEASATSLESETPSEPFYIPIWTLVLALGVMGIVAGSYRVGTKLDPNSLPRALWTTIQIGLGVLVLFVGQFLALVRIAPFDEKLSFKDAIMPFRLYGQVFKRLPSSASSVCTLAWGLTLIAAALFFIGGLNHWFSYLKSNRDRPAATQKR